MIELRGLSAGYQGVPVVERLDLTIGAGEIVALLGRNGMGKTTLLRTIAGQLRPLGGDIAIAGDVVRGGRPEAVARSGLSFLPDDRGVFPTLTVDENLALARRRGDAPPVDVHELLPVLRERADVRAGSLSGGQKQQLGLARAILAGRRAIVVDEFSQGLQPSVTRAVLGAFQALAATGVAVMLVDQSPDPLVEFATRVLAMEKGRVVLDEPAAAIRADRERLVAFLVV